MPNRIIRDGVLDSERYHNLPSDSARLLFMELLLLADDYGLVPLGHIFLIRKTTVMAGKTPEAMAQMLSSLADQDLLRPFESDGSRFGYIPRFRNYPRAAKPKWPIPEGPSGNEIRELQQKRLASAKHLRTNAPETETETETETEKQKKRDAVASSSRKGSMTTYPVWKAVTIAKGEKLFSDYKPIWDWAKEVGIDELWIDIACRVFNDYFEDKNHSRKQYIDWRAAFLNYVKKDYLKLWSRNKEGKYFLTTVGQQALDEYLAKERK